MPRIAFDSLPDDARLWVFSSDRELAAGESARLLEAVDSHLDQWTAHGTPLLSGREWRDDHFLIVGVDERSAGASGCSIDGLFRVLRRLEGELDARLTSGGLVFYRSGDGQVRADTRAEFTRASADGRVSDRTIVFDTSVTRRSEYRERFETEAGRSWHSALLETPATSG